MEHISKMDLEDISHEELQDALSHLLDVVNKQYGHVKPKDAEGVKAVMVEKIGKESPKEEMQEEGEEVPSEDMMMHEEEESPMKEEDEEEYFPTDFIEVAQPKIEMNRKRGR